MANGAEYRAHTPCYKSVSVGWDQDEQYQVKIEFFDERAAQAYRSTINRKHFHKYRRTRVSVNERTVSLPLPTNIAKIRTCDKQRGLVFVFESRAIADLWEKNTLLWRRYINAPGELYIDRYLTETDSLKLRRAIGRIRARELEASNDEREGTRKEGPLLPSIQKEGVNEGPRHTIRREVRLREARLREAHVREMERLLWQRQQDKIRREERARRKSRPDSEETQWTKREPRSGYPGLGLGEPKPIRNHVIGAFASLRPFER